MSNKNNINQYFSNILRAVISPNQVKQTGSPEEVASTICNFISRRPYYRQIRTEECGICTQNLMDLILNISDNEKVICDYLLRGIATKSENIIYLPKVLESLISYQFEKFFSQIGTYGGGEDSPAQSTYNEIKEILFLWSNQAISSFDNNGKYLTFSRIVQPLLKEIEFKSPDILKIKDMEFEHFNITSHWQTNILKLVVDKLKGKIKDLETKQNGTDPSPEAIDKAREKFVNEIDTEFERYNNVHDKKRKSR